MNRTEYAILNYNFQTHPLSQRGRAQPLSDPQMQRLYEGFKVVGEQIMRDQERELSMLDHGIRQMEREIVRMRYSNLTTASHSRPQGQ
jgi:hypothetical protein